MSTPFDDVVDEIRTRGFHNHRLEEHSSTVSQGILRDLLKICEPFRLDFTGGKIREWLDFPSPGGRARKLDLVVAEPSSDVAGPDLARLRLCGHRQSLNTLGLPTGHEHRFLTQERAKVSHNSWTPR